MSCNNGQILKTSSSGLWICGQDNDSATPGPAGPPGIVSIYVKTAFGAGGAEVFCNTGDVAVGAGGNGGGGLDSIRMLKDSSGSLAQDGDMPVGALVTSSLSSGGTFAQVICADLT